MPGGPPRRCGSGCRRCRTAKPTGGRRAWAARERAGMLPWSAADRLRRPVIRSGVAIASRVAARGRGSTMASTVRGWSPWLLAGLSTWLLGAASPAPRLAVPAQIRPNERFEWWATVQIMDPLREGIFSDSIQCEVEDLDPGETRTDRVQRLSGQDIVRLVPSVSAGDSAAFQFTSFATAEHARITFRVYLHDAQGKRWMASGSTEAMPGDFSLNNPSRFFERGGQRIEYVAIPPLGFTPPWPALLLVHGHGSHARQLIPRALSLAERGYFVMTMSQPGYGQSQGPADLMGPVTQRAVEGAYDMLRRMPGVDSTKVAAWGISRGATAVALLAERRPSLRAANVQSGISDLLATYRSTKVDGFPDTIVREAGSDSAAWRARSPIFGCEKIKASVLIFHGEEDPNVPAAQAHAFAQALKQRKAKFAAGFVPNQGHAFASKNLDPI